MDLAAVQGRLTQRVTPSPSLHLLVTVSHSYPSHLRNAKCKLITKVSRFYFFFNVLLFLSKMFFIGGEVKSFIHTVNIY